ncbi:MAG: M1 family metallopeptidase [Mucilaginibacter polytrichastri]|nr:M1 family metallopeptidase [Mucilaginibacter polytrichastri]
MNRIFTSLFAVFCFVNTAFAQNIQNNPGSNHGNKFEQLGTILTTPNEQRTASGAPGVKYWQQRADYNIKCTLDEKNLKLTGSETITYYNNSPDPLSYIWIQLDENQHNNLKNANYQSTTKMPEVASSQAIGQAEMSDKDNGFGFVISKITDNAGKKLPYVINKTMMRIDLPAALKPGAQMIFNIDWTYKIADRMVQGGRGGYEYFPEDKNYLFTMAQWYPRLCVYSDFQGWQNHQFTGRGEFALTFGNFKVQMTVPADHIVGSTGECKNYSAVLSAPHLARLQKAKTATEPVEIVTLAEAKKAETNPLSTSKTWVFEAENVRDFAWTSSRKFIWDGMGQKIEGKNVLCMSFYGKEAYNLYRKFSTRAVAHTIKTYSDFTIPFPYPVAQSVEAANGMEYPMICFNYGRTDADGTYSEITKNGMLGVIIHEVGHNFFPMIVNSDERQWTWMDEGLNSFVEYLTEELWDNKFPTKKGAAYTIVDYMKLPKDELEPTMTNSENIVRFGPNAYSKPATALNILRETIMGRELFDYAFKEYARRWAFKHPTPADFFRTMEDASGEDLDWFWRGWFYGTDACDISIDSVKAAKADFATENRAERSLRRNQAMLNPASAKPVLNSFDDLSKVRNRADKSIQFYTDKDTAARDFYWKYDRGQVKVDTVKFAKMAREKMPEPMKLSPNDFSAAERETYAGKFFYELTFTNRGGLVMPVIVEFTFADGSKYVDHVPAQIWRLNEKQCSKFYVLNKEVSSIKLDPMRETADIDESNNVWGKMPSPSRLQLFKQRMNTARGQSTGVNPMQVSGGK